MSWKKAGLTVIGTALVSAAIAAILAGLALLGFRWPKIIVLSAWIGAGVVGAGLAWALVAYGQRRWKMRFGGPRGPDIRIRLGPSRERGVYLEIHEEIMGAAGNGGFYLLAVLPIILIVMLIPWTIVLGLILWRYGEDDWQQHVAYVAYATILLAGTLVYLGDPDLFPEPKDKVLYFGTLLTAPVIVLDFLLGF